MLKNDDKVRAIYSGAKMGILAVKDVSNNRLVTEQESTEFLITCAGSTLI